MLSRWRCKLLTTPALLAFTASAMAGPNGATVVGGAATVQGQGTANVVVNQSSQNAIINWNTFNIGAGEKTTITMPNASSAELDRVTGGLGPSQIFGSLSSNGRVFLVNPDGILFGAGSRINVGSLLATTHDIANADFMAGNYIFNISGNPAASVVNQGIITAQTGGFAALVAPGVRNTGTITAKLGTIALASGNAFTLDLYGDNLITLGLNDSIASQVTDVSTMQPLSSLVGNTGKLRANGGRVELTAVAARQVVDSVINNSGVIEANTIGTHNGMIVLGAQTAATKPAGAPMQTVNVAGKLSAAGKRKGTTGGTIEVTGENVVLTGATINASGQAGGGVVLIGGDWGGGHPTTNLISNTSAYLQPYAVPTANAVSVDPATTIDASATITGSGGKVIVWSNDATIFNGTILARGGARSGNGGFVETSGHELTFNGSVNTSAPNGMVGTLLLDPLDATIALTAGNEVITVSSIEDALAAGDVVVTTVGTTGSETGDITVASSLTWANASTLTLNAYRDIDINSGVTISNTGAGNLVLRADATGTGIGTVNFLGSGNVDFSGSTGTVSVYYNPADNLAGSGVNATSYTSPTDYTPYVLTNSSVPNQLSAYMLVNTVYDLQNIQNNVTGNYALGTNIDASATANWNGGSGFVPIGNNNLNSNFSGIFDGQDQVISNLTINSNAAQVGLFGVNEGTIFNVGLSNVSITGNNNFSMIGALAGWNLGTISYSYSSGVVVSAGSEAGGLVGNNSGTIGQSYSIASVSGTGELGGLAGQSSNSITKSYATGNVTRVGIPVQGEGVGGLVGSAGGTITYSYATGNVVGYGLDPVGGLAGENLGSIVQSYATGSVSGQQANWVAGLIGLQLGTVSGSYWDTYTTGQQYGVGNQTSVGATAVTSDPTQSNAANYAFSISSYANFDFINTWFSLYGTRPFLQSEWSSTITNAHQLQLMSMKPSATYTLDTNIDLEPALATVNGTYPGMWGPGGFVPIENFTGVFNGEGNIINNLVVSSFNTSGLFGTIESSGVVLNLGLTNASSTQTFSTSLGDADAGILAGINYGTIERTSVSGSVAAQGNYDNAAGGTVGELVGVNFGIISQASAQAGNLYGGSAGGLVGVNFGTVTQAFASGNINGSFQVVGGLVGQNYGTISDSYAINTVPAANSPGAAGGLVGTSLSTATISHSYAAGTLSLSNCLPSCTISYDGAIVGGNPGIVLDSYWNTDTYQVPSGAASGAIGLTTVQLKSGLPAGFDPTVWGSNQSINSGYPYLLWQTDSTPLTIISAPPTIFMPVLSPGPNPNPNPPNNPQSACVICAVPNLGQFFQPFTNLISGLFAPPTKSPVLDNLDAATNTNSGTPTDTGAGETLSPHIADKQALNNLLTEIKPQLSANKTTDADPTLIQGIISALNPNAVYQNGIIYPSGYTGDPTQCVALAEALSPYQIPANNIGTTWKPDSGETIGPNLLPPPGTPIATFNNRVYPQHPPYITINSTRYEVHAAIYLGPVKDSQGNVIGMYMLEQNTPWNGGKAEVRTRLFDNMTLPYSVIAPSVTTNATN